jgi:hypothetical protein
VCPRGIIDVFVCPSLQSILQSIMDQGCGDEYRPVCELLAPDKVAATVHKWKLEILESCNEKANGSSTSVSSMDACYDHAEASMRLEEAIRSSAGLSTIVELRDTQANCEKSMLPLQRYVVCMYAHFV